MPAATPQPAAVARPPVGVAPRPIGNLAVAWSAPATDGEPGPAWTLADADAEHVLTERYVSRGTELRFLSTRDGRVVAQVPGWRDDARGNALRYESFPLLVRADLAITWRSYLELVGLDPATGATRWTASELAVLSIDASRRAVGDTLVLALWETGLATLDARTGRRRFSRESRLRVDTGGVADAERVYLLAPGPGEAGQLEALDARTGAVLWTFAIPDDPWGYWQVVVAGERVVLGGRSLVVLEAATGRELRRVLRPDGVAADGAARLAVVGGAVVQAFGGGPLVATDVATGALRWRRELALGMLTPGSDALWGCTGAGVVVALDPQTGATLWRRGMERCAGAWPSRRRWFRVAAGAPGGDALVVMTAEGIVTYLRGEVAEPEEHVLVEGRVTVDHVGRAGVRVNVGDIVVRTGRGGRYRAELGARALLPVGVDREEILRVSRRPCSTDGQGDAVRLDGRGRYHLDFDVAAWGYECDAACHCD